MIAGARAFLRARLNGSRYASNIARTVSANLLAQVVLLIAAPLLTRIYRPDAFGAMGVFTAILSVGLAVGTARFEWSMPNPRTATQASAVWLLGMVMLGVACFLWFVSWPTIRAAELPPDWTRLGDAGWLLPFALAGAGSLQLLQAWHVRVADLRPMSRVTLLQASVNVTVVVLVGLLLGASAGVWGLIAGMLVGVWVGALGLWTSARGLRAALWRLNGRRIGVTWLRYRGEAAWSTLAALLNTLSLAAIPLMLARHYRVEDVGFFALIQRIALGPIGAVSAAVRQSFWAEAAQLASADAAALDDLYRRSLRRLGAFGAVVGLIALAGPLYVGPMFGSSHWQPAGWVLAASVPMLLGQAVASPLSHLEVHGRQQWQAAWDTLRLLLLIAGLELSGHFQLSIAQAVLCASAIMGVMYGLLVYLNIRALAEAKGGFG